MAKTKRFRIPSEGSAEPMTVFARERKPQTTGGPWVFYVMDYFATGEGRTLMIMVDRSSNLDLSMQEFVNFCSPYYAPLIKSYTKELFLERYGGYLPSPLRVMLNYSNDIPSLKFLQEFHFAFC